MKIDRHHEHGIYEWWIVAFGHHINIRIEPQAFKDDLKKLSVLVDAGNPVARSFVERCYERWGSQPDLIRLDTLDNFMNGED